MAKKYTMKSQHYSNNGLKSRTQLAIIDHNYNVARGLATTVSGEQCFKYVYPKLKTKPIYEGKTYQFVKDLPNDAISLTGVIHQILPKLPKVTKRTLLQGMNQGSPSFYKCSCIVTYDSIYDAFLTMQNSKRLFLIFLQNNSKLIGQAIQSNSKEFIALENQTVRSHVQL